MGKTYYEKIEKEQNKLNAKMFKLNDFIESNLFEDLPLTDQNLLITQATAMGTYSNILGSRMDIMKERDDNDEKIISQILKDTKAILSDSEDDQSWQ